MGKIRLDEVADESYSFIRISRNFVLENKFLNIIYFQLNLNDKI
jgi:hypothetical protein